MRPQQYDPPEEFAAPPSPPSCGCSARATKRRCRRRLCRRNTGIRRRAGIPAAAGASSSLRGPAAAGARASSARASSASRTITRASATIRRAASAHYADEPQQDPSRYDDALYGRLETGEHDYQRDPAYPDDPYAYQGDYEEEPAPKKRSSGLMTVAAVLALAVVGTGAAFAYRTFVGSPRSGEPPIIRADNSPTKVVPAPSDAGGAKNLDRMLSGVAAKAGVARRDAGRRQSEVRRAARGVSAAEPERQPAARPRAYLRRRRWLRPPPARCRTTSRAGSGRSPSRAIRPTAASRQAPTASAEACDARRRRPGCGSWSWSHDTAAQPGLGQCQRQCADVRSRLGRFPATDPDGGDQSGPVAARPVVATSSRSPRRRTRPTHRRPIVRCRASSRACQPHLVAGEACRSRRKGRLLPRLRRPVRFVRGGGAGLQQPEICRRTVLRPKELTAVSLTPVL